MLKLWIDEVSSKSHLTITDRLALAHYRHELSFREPPLPRGVPLDAETLWQYWATNPEHYHAFRARKREIQTYLSTREEIDRQDQRQQLELLNLINTDASTYLALYPVVNDMFKKEPGRRVARPQVAVRALQMKNDIGRSLPEITRELCDCGRSHDEYCEANIQHSLRALERLLESFDTEASTT
jgi:hypothetical protein